jgi:hypothetical protein
VNDLLLALIMVVRELPPCTEEINGQVLLRAGVEYKCVAGEWRKLKQDKKCGRYGCLAQGDNT